MNIFELFGMIAINNKDANKAISDTGKKADHLAATVGKAFDKVGKFAVNCGKVMAKGLAVGTAAMTGLVVKGMGLAGELEQNMGGSEAVFKQFAESMQKTAREAYKNMGLSQSDYLATANKMGALFQGVGYSIEDSASITEKAMQRASDVASIMGLDVGQAMESIAGAAKGNFTMMDNLGVAINDTALANYALEKGITKSVAKMSTQEKVGLAMELFLEKTAYAAGNYAKENDTLAGSLTTAKAAFQDFLSGAGDADALTEALLNAGDVIIRKADKLVPKLVDGLNKLIKNLSPRLPGLIQSALPGIIEGAVSLLSGLAQAIPGVWSRIVWPAIQNLLKLTLGIELPKWHKFKLDVMNWWNNEVWPFVQDLFKAVFGIELPDFKTTISSISTWWTESVWPSIKALFGAVFSIFTEDEDGQTVGQRLIEWWGKVLDALGDVISAVFGIKLPSVREIADKINNWWKRVTGQTDVSMNVGTTFTGSSGTTHGGEKVGGFAKGLDFVPYDNFPAYLHYGETVLTRKDADAWRRGSTGNMAMLSAKFDQMQETFIQVLEGIRNQPVAINIDSKTAAVLMAKEMTKSIGNRNIQSLMGMGG